MISLDIVVWDGFKIVGAIVFFGLLALIGIAIFLVWAYAGIKRWFVGAIKPKRQCYHCRKKFSVPKETLKCEEFVCNGCLNFHGGPDELPRCRICDGKNCPSYGCCHV